MISILSAFGLWTLGAATTGIVGNFSTDAVKKTSKSFANRFKHYYKTEENAVAHLEFMSTVESNNPKKPFRDVEDTFENLANEEFSENYIQDLKEWILENQQTLLDGTEKVSGGFNIGTQTANGDINNVNGTQIVNRSVHGLKNE